MNLAGARRELAQAIDDQAEPNARKRTHSARQVLVTKGIEALNIELPRYSSLADVLRAAAAARQTPARQAFAVLIIYALAVKGVVPTDTANAVCALAESALVGALLRCGYPFSGSTYDKYQVLDQLHRRIDELLQPLEPTFPNMQGLYAG